MGGKNTAVLVMPIIQTRLAFNKATKNGLAVAEELKILASDKNDKIFGPFEAAKSIIRAL